MYGVTHISDEHSSDAHGAGTYTNCSGPVNLFSSTPPNVSLPLGSASEVAGSYEIPTILEDRMRP